MTDQTSRTPVIVVFGITGDLSKRKLLPAMYHLIKNDVLPPETVIIGTSRRPLDPADLLNTVELCVLEKDKVCDPKALDKVRQCLRTMQLDPFSSDGFKRLKENLEDLDHQGRRNRLFYMSVPASAYAPIVAQLAENGLNDEYARLLLEKPFGYDIASAKELISVVDSHFKENQVYRIDHYLAKEMAQNLLAFRIHNPIFRPLWNSHHIQSVQVRALQTIGIEGRSNFYEQTGALRDIVQSHLMQLLALTLMSIPTDMSSRAIHEAKQGFFDSLLPADPREAERGQYESYRDEVGNPRSAVETYAKVKLKSNSPQWKDTEIVLEHGKALSETTTQVLIEFKTEHERRRNSLTFQIQPNEGISLDLVIKEPGLEDKMQHTVLGFSYAETFKDYQQIDAYERVLMDVVAGDQSLFASSNEVLSTWRVLQPLIDNWQDNDRDLKSYPVGFKIASLD